MINRTILYSILIISILFSNDSNKHTLGRDNDPKTINDIKPFKLFLKKARWEILSTPGMRFMAKLYFPKTTIVHYDVDNTVAFTIDDGFCGIDNPEGDMTNEVRKLFNKYDAKATFFVTGTHCSHTNKDDVIALLDDGHEIVNHSMYDMPYSKHSKEAFENDFNQTNNILSEYTSNIPKWYRAPHASLSKNMQEVLDDKRYTHVVCDGFANDTSIPDAKWISSFMLKRTKPGSIILIHMPERGVREWNFEAMRLTLEGLNKRNLKIVTVSELSQIEQGN